MQFSTILIVGAVILSSNALSLESNQACQRACFSHRRRCPSDWVCLPEILALLGSITDISTI